MGRPIKDFDWDQFDKLCSFPDVITQADIAEIMRVSQDTCDRRVKERFPELTFAEYREKRQAHFRSSLLAAQVKAALGGNVTMLIWLGKNYLKQKEPKIEHEVAPKEGDKLAVEYAKQLTEMGVLPKDGSGNR